VCSFYLFFFFFFEVANFCCSRTSTSCWVQCFPRVATNLAIDMLKSGNTSDQDSDREPEPPTTAVDKTAARIGKRDAPKEAPAAEAGSVATRGRGGRRGGGFSGSEAGT